MNSHKIENNHAKQINSGEKRLSKTKKRLVIIFALVILAIAGYWIYTQYLFPTSFSPVVLNNTEQQRLNQKIRKLGIEPVENSAQQKQKNLTPEPYRELDAKREIFFTEREINALLANNTNLANKLAIDLSDNLASAKLLFDVDPDFPVIGGKTVNITAGLELYLGPDQPRAILKGVSLWGVPLPNAWLGNLKNTDLLQEFSSPSGFWQKLQAGVEKMEISEGKLKIKLKK